MRPFLRSMFFVISAGLLMTGCKQHSLQVDVSGIAYTAAVERFDKRLFGMDLDTVDQAIGGLYREFGDFFDVFNVHVISIGPASARLYPTYLSMFINDPINREVYEYGESIFAEMSGINQRVASGVKHYLYHYPDSIPPRIIGYVSRFNQGLFTVGRFIGVGLDQYLGADCDYYTQMGIARYLVRKKVPERIPLDIMYAWATQLYPYNDSADHVLSRMIHQGQLTYFLQAMFPDLGDAELMGFTTDQMRWCQNNESQMWTHLVEEKLLFSSDPLDIRKLIEDAPNTPFYTSESPGKAAVWQGLQIIRAYAARNSKLSLHAILSNRDYQEILRESRYDP